MKYECLIHKSKDVLKRVQLETLCKYFAGWNIILRCVYLAVAIDGKEETLYKLIYPDPPNIRVGKNMVLMLRSTLVMDCAISIGFSLLLVLGVKKHNYRLVRVCFVYGVLVFVFSVIGTLPATVWKLASGDVENIGRRLLSLLLSSICAFQLYIVRKTYLKFQALCDDRKAIMDEDKDNISHINIEYKKYVV